MRRLARVRAALARSAPPQPSGYLRVPVRARRASRLRGSGWLLVAGPLLFGALFLAMRQDLQLQMLLVEKVELEERCDRLRQELREGQRELVTQANFVRIGQYSDGRGMRSPEREQVTALLEEPLAVAEEERPLTLAVFEFLSGAEDVRASAVTSERPPAPERESLGSVFDDPEGWE